MIFLVHVWNDQHLMPRLLAQVKELGYPILVIGDGVKLEPHCKKGTLWFELNRAKGKDQGGLWTHRYLEHFLAHSAENHLCRIDPDTCVWRKFALPEGDYDLFGNITTRKGISWVKGGCIGFTRAAAHRIVASRFLLERQYARSNYLRYSRFRWAHEKESREPLAFQDYPVGHVCHRLSLKLREWGEVKILGNQNVIPERENYAITHPHPLLE